MSTDTRPGRVRHEVRARVARIVFDHPERLNALTPAMCGELDAAVAELEARNDVRVVVVTGAGERAFVSGADLRAEGNGETGFDRSQFHALARLKIPVIAMIRGYCLGGGLAIALEADIRVAAADAVFGIPAARLGIGYPLDEIARLTALVGPATASEILFLGSTLDAQKAERVGLVNRVVGGGELEAAVDDLAAQIEANAPLAVAAAKAGIQVASLGADAAAAETLRDACSRSDDAIEGRRAFLEKRRPRFTGR